MAKKSKKISFLPLVCGLLGLVSIVAFSFLTMVVINLESELLNSETITSYSGLALIFGGTANYEVVTKLGNSSTSSTGELEGLGFNTFTFIILLLTLLGSILLILTMFTKSKNTNLLKLVSAGLLIAAGIMMFTCAENVAEHIARAMNMDKLELIDEFADESKAGLGAIIGGVLACVSGGGSLCSIVLDK